MTAVTLARRHPPMRPVTLPCAPSPIHAPASASQDSSVVALIAHAAGAQLGRRAERCGRARRRAKRCGRRAHAGPHTALGAPRSPPLGASAVAAWRARGEAAHVGRGQGSDGAVLRHLPADLRGKACANARDPHDERRLRHLTSSHNEYPETSGASEVDCGHRTSWAHLDRGRQRQPQRHVDHCTRATASKGGTTPNDQTI